MTSEPVSGLPDPKYAKVNDDTIRAVIEETMAGARKIALEEMAALGERFKAEALDMAAELRTALAQLDEARARAGNHEDENFALHAALGAAEARLEELTRERDEAKAGEAYQMKRAEDAEEEAFKQNQSFIAAETERDTFRARLEEAKAEWKDARSRIMSVEYEDVGGPVKWKDIRHTFLHVMAGDEYNSALGQWKPRAFLHQGGSE